MKNLLNRVNLAISIISSVVMFLPSYIANPSAVITGGKIVLDGGKKFRGKRVFGDHKTLSGFLGGVFFGFIIGIIIQATGYYWHPILYSHDLVTAIEIILILSIGSMLGDLVGSFIKRQVGYEPGSEALFLDQYPFALVSLLLVFLIFPQKFLILFPLPGIITILILTPLLHRAVNILGYKMKMKDVPY